jgi:protoporphyrinogen oxidase
LVFGDRHSAYPPSLPGLLRGLGARRALAAGASWLVRPGGTEGPGDAGFESFVVGRVGRSAYEGFYRPYAEKVWGLPPAELSQTVAKKRYSSSSPGRMLRGRRREALDRYMYPHLGMAGLARHLRSTAERAGVRVRTGKAFDPAGAEPHAAVVVHTGRLRDLAPDAGLAHRGTYLVYLCLARTRVSPVETWYLPERRFWFGRVSEPQNYSRGLRREGETVLCLEIPEGSLGGGLDFTAHVDELMDQLREARILRGAPEVLEVSQHFLPDVYPIYRRGWHDDWQRAMDRVAGMGKVFPVGRQGLFLHCNIDHCVTIAKQAVEHIHAGGTSEAWAAKARGYLGVRVRD